MNCNKIANCSDMLFFVNAKQTSDPIDKLHIYYSFQKLFIGYRLQLSVAVERWHLQCKTYSKKTLRLAESPSFHFGRSLIRF
jgi:hypothetical protein